MQREQDTLAASGDRNARYRPAPRVITRWHDSGAVALNVETGLCWELNATGGEMWDRLLRGDTVAELAPALAIKWNVPQATVEEDTLALLRDLLRAELLCPRR